MEMKTIKLSPSLCLQYLFGMILFPPSSVFCIMHVPLKELTVCLYGRAYQRMFMKYYLEQGIPGLFMVKEKYLSSDFYVICRLYQELALINYFLYLLGTLIN